MVDHDARFKLIIQEFCLKFIELFTPGILQRGDVCSIEFLDKEILSELVDFQRREPDLIAKVSFDDGSDVVYLVHIEIQSHRQSGFPFRMLTYYLLISNRFPSTPIVPVALFTHGTANRAEPDLVVASVPGHGEILRFTYTAIYLSQLDWRDFACRENPVAAALMAKMKIAPGDRPKAKAECLRVAASLELNRDQITLIGRFVETYLPLDEAEQAEYNEIVEAMPMAEQQDVTLVLTYWEQKGLEKGREEGREEGRRMLIRLLERRFGAVPEDVKAAVHRLDGKGLEELGIALLDAPDFESWRTRLESLHA